ncbi:MAG: protein of unknown function with transrane region [Patescibacteria group bacterium]|nr:protein of unknown function with transrane region [Patescibacteria group bacterium]
MNSTPNVPYINLEFIFTKIYDFLVFIKNFIVTGGHVDTASGTTDYAGIVHHTGSWLLTILVFLFIGLFAWAVYIRIRIHEVDQNLNESYSGHFIPPVPKSEHKNQRWVAITNHFASDNQNDWRAAILDADSMLDELVTGLGYTGAGLGEKLNQVRDVDFPTKQAAWEAHKVRNIIAHQGGGYNLSERQKDLVRKHYENVFRSSGII